MTPNRVESGEIFQTTFLFFILFPSVIYHLYNNYSTIVVNKQQDSSKLCEFCFNVTIVTRDNGQNVKIELEFCKAKFPKIQIPCDEIIN